MIYCAANAGITQLVECKLPKLDVASSSLVARSIFFWGMVDVPISEVLYDLNQYILGDDFVKGCITRNGHLPVFVFGDV